MSPSIHDTAVLRLRRVGQRYTTSRRTLVEILDEARQPLSIPEVVGARGALAQSSVYRNLAVLERAAVVRRIVTTGEFACYELAEDLTGHHHHLICSACGSVADFTVASELEQQLAAALSHAAAEHRFTVDGHRLNLVGTCAACTG